MKSKELLEEYLRRLVKTRSSGEIHFFPGWDKIEVEIALLKWILEVE